MNNLKLSYLRIFGFSLLFIFGILFFAGCQSPEKENNPATESTPKIRVGVYNGNGASAVCVIETLEALKIDSGIHSRPVTPVDIQRDVLDSLDVLVFPGGSGSKEYNSLGLLNAEKVKTFAAQANKGLVGICAGGYLFASTEGYPALKVLKAETIREHYDRGRGLIGFSLNEDGKKIFPELKDYDTNFVQFYDGPIYEISDVESVAVNALITSDIATHANDPRDVTPGKAAFLTAPFGEGKMFVSVGHPESTPGMRWMVPRMVRWVAGQDLISYNHILVRPQINNKEILYFPETIAQEKTNFWNLFSEDDDEIIQAIDNLYAIKSRPSIRWSIGLLRHSSAKVRLKAAEYLVETEYTDALPDLSAAAQTEQNAQVKEQLSGYLSRLKSMVY